MPNQLCPCGTQLNFQNCCADFINGHAKPPSALALLRARYVAYTLGNIDYIQATHDPATLNKFDANIARSWADSADWLGLEVLECHNGNEDDMRGTVEFKVHYRQRNKRELHHEISEFVKHDGEWFYQDGRTPIVATQVNSPKIGRNAPCPCGSGKKYKHCCL